jgi:hypothetical protein
MLEAKHQLRFVGYLFSEVKYAECAQAVVAKQV